MAENALGASGKASDKTTGANMGIGEDKPKALDAQGAIGHAFTGEHTNEPNCSLVLPKHGPTNALRRRRCHRRHCGQDRRSPRQGRHDREAVHYGGQHRRHSTECRGRQECEKQLGCYIGWLETRRFEGGLYDYL